MLKIKPSLDKILDFEFAFTETYVRMQDAHPAIREAHCLAAQFPAICLPPKPDDLFVGRIRYRGVGFTPQFREGQETFGFYCEPSLIYQRLRDHDLPVDVRTADLIDFWRDETTLHRVKSRFTPQMKAALPSDDWIHGCETAFPLYRMAGANMNFDRLLRLGIPGLRREIINAYRERTGYDSAELYTAMLLALDVLVDTARYYINLLREQQLAGTQHPTELEIMAQTLINITQKAPATLREAIQLLYLYSMHANLYANYGRMDVYLGDFYANDLASGRLTESEAFALLLSLWRMFPSYDENPSVNGDTRVFLGGKGRRNEINADRFALLAMKVSRQFRQTYPQLSLRFYEGQNPALYQQALDLLGEGLTYPILYNDDVNIPAVMSAFGVSEEEAEQYTPFSCGEYVLSGMSFGTPNAIINLPKALELTLYNGCDPVSGKLAGLALGSLADYATFDDLFNAYAKQVSYFTHAAAQAQKLTYDAAGQDAPFLYFSMLYDDCIARGKGVFSGGIKYLGGTYETYGNITTADSLTAIKTLVYDRAEIAPETLLTALQANFEGYDSVRQKLLNAPKFGNDDDEADAMAQRVHNHVCAVTAAQAKPVGLDSFLVVVINNSANVVLGHQTAASADGRLAGTPLTNGHTAMNGMDQNGITALLNSMTKLDPSCHAGATHNLKLSPQMFTLYRPQLEAALATYFEQGGTQAMLTVVCREDLLRALDEPEKYGHILVRTGGFSARFVDLPPDVQQDILNRTLWA